MFVTVADGSEGFRPVKVVPVFEVGDWFKELGGEGEADGGHVFYAYKSVVHLLDVLTQNESWTVAIVARLKAMEVVHVRPPLSTAGNEGVKVKFGVFTHFLKMPKNIINLLLSLGASSTACATSVCSSEILELGVAAWSFS